MSLIYILEDDTQICEIESFALKNAGYEVKLFQKAGDMLAQLQKQTPDLFLMDVMFPDADGIHVVQKLRGQERFRQIPILLVSGRSTELDIVRGLDAGADDYLTKPFGLMEMISRVKALLRRNSQDTDVPVEMERIRMDKEKREVLIDGTPCNLTNKEFELLYLLVKRKGNVIRRDELMERIWGIDYEGESRTLDIHIRSLRKKLGEEGSYIKTIRGVGYRYDN